MFALSTYNERTLLFLGYLCVVGREVSWERWESGEPGRWERFMGGVRWQGGKGGRIVRWHGRRGEKEVMRWQLGKGGRVVSRDGGMEFQDKIVLYCSREAKCE